MNTEKFIHAAQALTAQSLGSLTDFYAPDCVFEDPFQSVTGRQAVHGIYKSMFDSLHQPRFVDVRIIGQNQGPTVIVAWRFEFAFKPDARRESIPGLSLLELDGEGLIARHTDYWDGSRLMQALPMVGGLIGWLRTKIAHA